MDECELQRTTEAAAPAPSRPLKTPSSATSRLSLPKRQAWKVMPTRQIDTMVKTRVRVSIVAFVKG